MARRWWRWARRPVSYAQASAVHFTVAGILAAAALVSAGYGARATARIDAARLKRVFGAYLIFAAAMLPLKHVLMGGADEVLSSTGASLRIVALLPLLALGGLSGYVSGLLGVGGGTVMVPALTLGMGMGQKLAQGTALAAMVLSAATGAMTHYRMGQVITHLLPGLLIGAFLGAAIGGTLATALPDLVLKSACGLGFSAIGLRYILSGRPSRAAESGNDDQPGN